MLMKFVKVISRTLQGLLALLLSLLVLVVVVLTVALGTETGRLWLVERGTTLAGNAGVDIHMTQLQSPGLDQWALASLTVDMDGSRIIAIDQLALSWRPWSLLQKHIEIHSLTAARVHYFEQEPGEPEEEPADDSGGGQMWPVTLDRLAVGEIGVFDTAGDTRLPLMRVGGAAKLFHDNIPVQLQADVETLSDPVTKLTVDSQALSSTQIRITGSLHEAPAGWLGNAWVVVLAAGVVMGLALGARHVQGLFLLPITEGRGWSRELFGFALAVQNLAWGLAQPLAGMVADRMGSRRVVVFGLLLYALGFMLFMNLGAKKFDRYLLPAHLPLEFIAGAGWVMALNLAQRQATQATVRLWPLAAAAVVIMAQALFALPTFPYYLTYYNPLLGGAARAPEVMMIGWGEGGLLALHLTGQSLNIYSQIGMILLVGLVTKNSILLVEYANQGLARGLDSLDAILEAGRIRFRPILMTSVATIMGVMPIAIGTGAGAVSRRPLGYAIVGGLSFSTLLTLFVVPVVWLQAERFLAHRRRSTAAAPVPTAEPLGAK